MKALDLARPAVLLGLAAVLSVIGFQLWVTPSNPPGYHRDEAALSYNAYTIATTGRDEDGAVMPLFRHDVHLRQPRERVVHAPTRPARPLLGRFRGYRLF